MIGMIKLVSLMGALVSGLPNPAPYTGTALPLAEPLPPTHTNNIQARNGGHMTLQWSPQGRFLFLLGGNIAQGVVDSLYASLGQGGPAEALTENFVSWLTSNEHDSQVYYAQVLWEAATFKGGVFGVGPGNIGNTLGLAIQMDPNILPSDIEDLRRAIILWAQQGAGLVQVIQRVNDFFDPASIGATPVKRSMLIEGRARGNQCPTDTNMLQYATIDVPDLDINTNIRFAGLCDA